MKKKGICIIDDHEIIRTGIKRLINSSESYEVVYEFHSNASLLNQPLTKNIDLIIQDLDLDDGTDISQLELIQYKCPNIPILIYTMHAESLYGLACLEYQVAGYLTKDKPVSELRKAIDAILSGKRYFSEELSEILSNQYLQKNSKKNQLSQREQEVYVLIGEGISIGQIAKKLYLNIKTISTYRRRILDKLELSSTSEIIHHYLTKKMTH